jgi:hypothetical protein
MVLGIMSGIGSLGTEPNPFALQMFMIECSVNNYRAQEGEFPDSLGELVDYKYSSMGKKDLADPWGEPIGYAQGGDMFVIWSTGADKIMGTRDDWVWGHLPLYVERWRAIQAETGAWADTNALQEAVPEKVLPSTVIQNPPHRHLTEEELAKETEWLIQQVEEDRRARRVFMRNAKVAGITLIRAICAVTVWAVARKRARRK